MATADSREGAVRRFSGKTEDGTELEKWITWVKRYLYSSNLDIEAYGNKVASLLDGAAEKCIERLPPEDLYEPSGEEKVFSKLRARFPVQTTQDKSSECLGEFFTFRALPGERVPFF